MNIHGNISFPAPPLWAVLERKLIDLMNDAIEPLMERYVREDGTILWPTTEDHTGIDALDDAYESFHNWPLFYALGGHEKFKRISFREFDAITKQFAGYDTGFGHAMVVKEYEQGYDWFHQGEGYLFFYMLGLADPNDEATRERAVRFAGFYNNEDPDAPNFDAELKLIRAPHPGSMGPRYDNFDTYIPWGYKRWKQFYGLPFQDVPGFTKVQDAHDEQLAVRMGETMKERMSRGDAVVNLAATSMMTNAYLYTGEEKYRIWVREYVEAWMKRAAGNDGIVPDNVGLTGEIGEYMNGKWYGSYYGWTWPHGWLCVGNAVTIASENLTLLEGNPNYMDFLRSQIDMLAEQAIEMDGTLHAPYKHGDPGNYTYMLWDKDVLVQDRGAGEDQIRRSEGQQEDTLLWKDGWFEFRPLGAMELAHLCMMTMEKQDFERAKRLRNNHTDEWHRIVEIPAKDQGGHEAPWLAYQQGEFEQYPERLLMYNLEQVYGRLAYMREDTQDPATYTDGYLQRRNPVTVEGLVQLTMGGPLPVYNGGMLMVRVRYFDKQQKRPGLPKDVGALIGKMKDDGLELQLANLSATETREMIIGAGAYGEHQFTTVAYERMEDGELKRIEASVDRPHLTVRLEPGALVKLELGMRRFANQPSYAFPEM
ncbi:hypothetical protein [Paenibacillus sp. HB172176]|uniref:hypothetical protein n=1 Tax=Paenibacillus sp. HB172176 TaxID=2493690 RepID=UPI001439801C|nr:hypothetical protein [Paenibacillus sp. HB172176]